MQNYSNEGYVKLNLRVALVVFFCVYKYHSTKVWLQLAQWFLRRRLKFMTYDDGRQVMAKAHMAFDQVS
jgi:hypothetical protein